MITAQVVPEETGKKRENSAVNERCSCLLLGILLATIFTNGHREIHK